MTKRGMDREEKKEYKLGSYYILKQYSYQSKEEIIITLKVLIYGIYNLSPFMSYFL